MQLRDRAEHDRRRRHGWDLAFTTKALRSYDSRVIKYADQFIAQMQRRAGQAVNITEWLEWYAFDVMGKTFAAARPREKYVADKLTGNRRSCFRAFFQSSGKGTVSYLYRHDAPDERVTARLPRHSTLGNPDHDGAGASYIEPFYDTSAL